MVRSLAQCQPARSMMTRAWAPGVTAVAQLVEHELHRGLVSTLGRTRATPVSRSGQTAPNR